MNPVNPARIEAIDILRGSALLGILVMNIQAFALPIAAYFNPMVYGDFSGSDRVAWLVTRLFFDVKFLSIFSMLFGASLVLAGGGVQAKKRLAWLLVFGLIHGYFLFVGDILFTYAIVGFLILPARTWAIKTQLRAGLALLMASPLTLAGLGICHEWLPDSLQSELFRTVTDLDVARDLAVFRSDYLSQLPHRAELSFSNQIHGTAFESGWQAAGCMLLGMAAVRSGFFQRTHEFIRVAVGFFSIGILMSALGVFFAMKNQFAPHAWLIGQSLHMAGSAGIAFAWLTGLVALSRMRALQGIFSNIARLGKVGFSAYILQSIAGMFVFCGQGFGQYGSWNRVDLIIAAVLFWVFQIFLAMAWTSRFRVGPLEAVWRGLSRGDFSLGRIS